MKTTQVLTRAAGMLGPKADEFIRNDIFVEMAMVGPWNTGKSTALVDWLILSGVNYPGCHLVLCRAKFTDLKRTTLPKLLSRMGKLVANHNKNEGYIEFPRVKDSPPSRIWMFGLDRHDLREVLKSFEPFRAAVEESNEVSSMALDLLLGRCRQKVRHQSETNADWCKTLAPIWGVDEDTVASVLGFGPKELNEPRVGTNQLKHVFNPEGDDQTWRRMVNLPYPGKDEMTPAWVERNVGICEAILPPQRIGSYKFQPGDYAIVLNQKRKGFVKADHGTTIELLDGSKHQKSNIGFVRQRAAIFVWPYENESRNIQADRNFLYMEDPSIRERYMEAKIDAKEGLIFPMFDRALHVVKKPTIELGGSLSGVGSVDHGYRHPTAALWGIKTKWPSGGALILKEYLVSGLSASENAYAVKALADPKIATIWGCDPSMNRTEATSMRCVMDEYRDAGIMVIPAANNREQTINAVQEALTPHYDPRTRELRPLLFISEECEKLIEALLTAKWSDLTTRRDNWQVDMVDALRYFVDMMAMTGLTYNPESVKPRVKKWA